MRKTTVVFSDAQWNRLSTIARREHRSPKQQVEFLILRALGWELPPLEPGESESQRDPSAGGPPVPAPAGEGGGP
jgi:hypothetical protein